jgi:4-amino-4-deoxy-L-arabinose transferase-like glycosyltransferase
VAREVSAAAPRARVLLIGIVVLIVLRGVMAAATPLSYDETYYWLWSRHLAAGYFDHPPAIAYVIRFGTLLFGDTSIGVRFGTLLLSAAASWAVWKTAGLLLKDNAAALLAALFFNLMPMIGVEALVATPDAPEMAAAAFLLLFLAKIAETGDGRWWIAAGIAAGFALLSKLTGFFLGAGILVWLVLAKRERHWFASFWPYLGGALALLMFVPVVLWNAAHDWVAFAFQFGRIESGGLTLRFLGEFLGTQLGLATPFIAVLGTAGFVRILRTREARYENATLIAAIMIPGIAYFLGHSLHARVQGNWPSFLYPALAIAAAAASRAIPRGWITGISARLAVPVAALMLAVVYAQTLFGIVPLPRDPAARLLAFGLAPVADAVEKLRADNGAGAVLTTGYAATGWFAFYLPTHPPVIQVNERFRWLNESAPPARLFEGPLLYVSDVRNAQVAEIAKRFARVTPLARIPRRVNGYVMEEYEVYRVEGPRGEPLAYGR